MKNIGKHLSNQYKSPKRFFRSRAFISYRKFKQNIVIKIQKICEKRFTMKFILCLCVMYFKLNYFKM